MLATASSEVFSNDYELLQEGAEWLASFIDQLIKEAAEFAQPIIEILLEALANLKTDLLQLYALCGQDSTQVFIEIERELLTAEVLQFVTELSTSKAEHQKLAAILSALETDFFADNQDLLHLPEGYIAILEAALNDMTIFRLMSTMVAKPGSRHAGTNPTYHTAKVVCAWLEEARNRFTPESAPEQKAQFKAELLAAIAHDFGKVFNPKSDAHHKLSLQLAGSGIKHVAREQAFAEQVPLANFLVHNHDICGHIAAGRRKYENVLAVLKTEEKGRDYLRSLFYIQLADMGAITTMPEAHKNENLTIWAMLCTDLGYGELVAEIIGHFPQFAEILNRRIAVV